MAVAIEVGRRCRGVPAVAADAVLVWRHLAKAAIAQVGEQPQAVVAADHEVGEAVTVEVAHLDAVGIQPATTDAGPSGHRCETSVAIIKEEAVIDRHGLIGALSKAATANGNQVEVAIAIDVEQADTTAEALQNGQVTSLFAVDRGEDHPAGLGLFGEPQRQDGGTAPCRRDRWGGDRFGSRW